MKHSLGRKLSELMDSGKAKEGAPASVTGRHSAAACAEGAFGAVGAAPAAARGVAKLMQGRAGGAREDGESNANPFLKSKADRPSFSVRRVPDWIYYLADLVLLSAVVWLVLLKPTAPTWVDWTTCLLLTLVGAGLGLWPWARNAMAEETPVPLEELPQWTLARKEDGKTYVVHLRHPFCAVEITETSWSGVQPKPVWLSGAPNISPEDVKRLQLGAVDFYRNTPSSQASPAVGEAASAA